MTDEQIIASLQQGDHLTFGLHGRNFEVMDLMAKMERAGLIRTDDDSLSQETRREAEWIAEDRRHEAPELILALIDKEKD